MSFSNSAFPRSSGPLLHGTLTSLANRPQGPHLLDFTEGWNDERCSTRQWYIGQPAKTFTHLQYRKERSGFQHEFIVAELNNNTVCRFDRRGDSKALEKPFMGDPMEAEDTAHVISQAEPEFSQLDKTSDIELRIHFPRGQDLITILATCNGIKADPRAKYYELLRYNCYFFSWTIITAAARRTVDWSLAIQDTELWDKLVQSSIGRLTSSHSARKDKTRSKSSRKSRANQPFSEPPTFSGAQYFVETLQNALLEARLKIGHVLSESLLISSLEKTMPEASAECIRSATIEAAKRYAYYAARDAAMEAVAETMWQRILNNPTAANAWETQSRRVEQALRVAASAAARADLEQELEGQKWEQSWDKAWGGVDTPDLVLLRSKAAWRVAWTTACLANKEYLSIVCIGLTECLMSSLPYSMSDALKFERPYGLYTNVDVERFIQKRIEKHSKRAGKTQTASPEAVRLDIEKAMCRAWVNSISFSLD